jgi:cation transport regulator ChaC
VEPTSEPLWYFAYGSNLSQATFTGRRGIRPLQKRRGWLEGYRLCFDIPIGPGERAVANICAATGARTYGAAYLITPADAEHLDRTEGVGREVYSRIAVAVCTETGDRLDAFAYQSTFRTEGRKPSLRYVGLLLEGAREHGLPDDYVRYLESLELAVDERLPTQEKKVR